MTGHNKLGYYRRIIFSYVFILAIPLIIYIGFSFYLFRANAIRDLSETLDIESNRQFSLLSNNLSNIYNLADAIRTDSTFVYYDDYDAPIKDIQIIQNLSKYYKQTNSCDFVYYYNKKEGLVFSTNGIYDYSFFNENIFTLDDISPLSNSNISITRAYSSAFNQKGIAIRTKVFSNKDNELICIITDTTLMQMFMLPFSLDKAKEIVRYNDELIFANDADILDFSKERYIENIFNQGFYSFEFYTPRSFLYSQLTNNLLFITIICLGVIFLAIPSLRYLVKKNYKPINSLLKKFNNNDFTESFKEVTNEFEYMDYLLSNIIESNNLLKISNQQYLVDSMLYTIIHSKIDKDDENYNKLLELNISVNKKSLFFIIFSQENSDSLRGVKTLIDGLDKTELYEIFLPSGIIVYFVTSDNESDFVKEKIKDINNYADCVCSEIVSDVSLLHKSFKSAQNKIFVIKKDVVFPIVEIENLQESLFQEDFNKAKYLLDSLLDEYRFYESYLRFMVYIQIIILINGKVSIEELLSKNGEVDFENLTSEIYKQFYIFVEKKQQQNAIKYQKKNINDIIEYIDLNYYKKDFNIKELAYIFSSTPSNISHFFKKNTGVTLSSYILDKKIEKTKDLLLQGDLKVSEIADALGFTNVSLFIQLFKKHEGVTPGNFLSKKYEENKE